MDGVTEKFSVFDFFNLIIVGIIFITILGIANYYQAIIMLKKIAEIVAEDKLLEAGTIIVFLCVSLVIGMIFQVMFQYIKEKMNLEKEILSNKRLFDNEIRMEEVKKEAKQYFNIKKQEQELTDKQWIAFFAYCTYYLQIKKLDKKTERMYETEGLTALLACSFLVTAVLNILIVIIQQMFFETDIDLQVLIAKIGVGIILYIIIGIMLFYRYNILNKNRIKMIFSIYTANIRIEERQC